MKKNKTLGDELKEACDKCSQAMIRLTQEMNKLSNNKKYKSIGSKYHN